MLFNKGQGNNSLLFILIILAVGFFAYREGYFSNLGKKPASTNNVTYQSQYSQNYTMEDPCIGPVAFSYAVTEKSTGKSIPTNGYIVTGDLGSKNQLSKNSIYQVLYGQNTTQFYPLLKQVKTTCDNSVTDNAQLVEVEKELDTYMTNANGLINSPSKQQTLNANDKFTTTVHFSTHPLKWYGNPSSTCKNVAVIEYDKTYIMRLVPVLGMESTNKPDFFNYASEEYDTADSYFIKKLTDYDSGDFTFTVESTGIKPLDESDLRINFYDCNIGLNTNTRSISEGIQNNNYQSISLAPQFKILYIQ